MCGGEGVGGGGCERERERMSEKKRQRQYMKSMQPLKSKYNLIYSAFDKCVCVYVCACLGG